MDIPREGRQLTPCHWLVGHLVVFAESLTDASSSLSTSSTKETTRVVATVTCREHFCSSLNNKWLAYASPDGTIKVVRDNQTLTAILQRVDPVIRIDYVDNTTGAVWFCVQNETWQRWVWAWNHNVKTATQANLVKGPDVTNEYKQRVFTAREELHKTASVYAYRKAPGEYWIHNDQARQPDTKIEFEPAWYDLATSSFMALNDEVISSDDDEDEDNDEEDKTLTLLDDNETKHQGVATAEEEEEEEEEASQPDVEQLTLTRKTKKIDDEEEREDEEEEEEEEQEQMVVLSS